MKRLMCGIPISEGALRRLAADLTKQYAIANRHFRHVLTSAERREQYADHYARTIMRLTA